jgi:hypothetical protein
MAPAAAPPPSRRGGYPTSTLTRRPVRTSARGASITKMEYYKAAA